MSMNIVKIRNGGAVLNNKSLFMILNDTNNNVLIASKNSIAEMIAFKLVNNVDIVLRQ